MKKVEFEDDIVAEVKADFEKRREERKPLELQWRLNMNFLMGNQYSEISPSGTVEDYGKQYFWQEREVYNHIAPIIETRLSKMERVKANVSVRPLTSDESDLNTAKYATRLLKSIEDENNLNEKIALANMWSETCGTVFYKVIWDKKKGRLIGRTKNKNVYEGDIEVIVCPPFEIFPDSLTADSIESCKSIIHAKAYSTAEIKNIWGVDVKGTNVNVFGLDIDCSTGGLGYSGSVPKVVFQTKEEHQIVIERYEAPCEEFPQGRLCIVAGDRLLFYGPLPYKNGVNDRLSFPFVRQTAIAGTGSFFGISVIERVIPVQRAYNALRNRKHELLNRIAMGVLAVEDGSVDVEDLEEEGLSPGKVIIYRQGSNIPTLLNLGSMPSDFTREEEKLLDEFIMISGVSDFMKYSKLPSNVNSGIALSLIAEQDDTRLSATANAIRYAIKTIGQHILRLYKQFAAVKRLKRIAGENGDIELKYFSANDISSDDIVFDSDNELIDTPANRRNMVVELLKMGVLSDEDGKMSASTKLKVFEMLGFGNWESGRDLDEYHKKYAMKENETFASDMSEADEIDNHAIHINEHMKYLLGNSLADAVKEKVKLHIKQHKAFMENAFQNTITEGQNGRE